jgi:hypothetical protein
MAPVGGQSTRPKSSVQKVYGTSDFEFGWGYVRHVEIVGDDGSTVGRSGLSESRC